MPMKLVSDKCRLSGFTNLGSQNKGISKNIVPVSKVLWPVKYQLMLKKQKRAEREEK